MRRGEIWWAELEPPAGRRPVVLLSREEAYSIRSLVIVAPLTTRVRNIAAEVPLSAENGMSQDCVVNLDVITTVPKDCLRSRIAMLSPKNLRDVEGAMRFALGLEQESIDRYAV
jgi:mRNA interferase MazF